MLALLLLLRASGPDSVPADSTLVLSGGKYLDVRKGMLRPNGAIVVRGGKIVALHQPGSGWRPPADVRVLRRPVLVLEAGGPIG
jgi:hypothetical protein